MNCREFLARHTEYVDGLVQPAVGALMRHHARTCASCARYDRVVRRGAELARQLLPTLEVSPDFAARVQHRLFHVRDDMARRRGSLTPAYAAAAAVLLVSATAAVLSFFAGRTPVVDGRVAWAVAPPAITQLGANARAVDAAPMLSIAAQVTQPDVASIEADAKGRDPHVANPAAWPVYSRGAVAVAFPDSRATVVVRPADFRRSSAQPQAGPLLIRH